MTEFLTDVVEGAVAHPVYALMLLAGAVMTASAWWGNRSFNKVLAQFNEHAPETNSNVHVLYPDAS